MEAGQQRQMFAIAKETADEVFKRIAPVLHELQEFRGLSRQIDDLRKQSDELKKLLTDIVHHLNTEHIRQEEEIREMRNDELDRSVRQPLVRELCRTAKEVMKARARFFRETPKESCTREVGLDLYDRLYLDLTEKLSRHGVTAYSSVPESPFDPVLHEAIRREKRPTNHPALAGKVAEEESPGFVLGEVVLEKASVFLFEQCNL